MTFEKGHSSKIHSLLCISASLPHLAVSHASLFTLPSSSCVGGGSFLSHFSVAASCSFPSYFSSVFAKFPGAQCSRVDKRGSFAIFIFSPLCLASPAIFAAFINFIGGWKQFVYSRRNGGILVMWNEVPVVCRGFHSGIVWSEVAPEFNDAALCHHGVQAYSSVRLVESFWDGSLLCEVQQLPHSSLLWIPKSCIAW